MHKIEQSTSDDHALFTREVHHTPMKPYIQLFPSVLHPVLLIHRFIAAYQLQFDRKHRIERFLTCVYYRLIKTEVRTACGSGRANQRREVKYVTAGNDNGECNEQSGDVERSSDARCFARRQLCLRGALDRNLLPAFLSGATSTP